MSEDAEVEHYVFKFGGSCFQNAAAFDNALLILRNYGDKKITVVCSAFLGITDKLIALFEDACDVETIGPRIQELREFHDGVIDEVISTDSEMNSRSHDYVGDWLDRLKDAVLQRTGTCPELDIKDYVLSFGERLSTFIFTCCISAVGIPAEFISSDEIIVTNEFFGSALPDLEKTEEKVREKVLPLLTEGKVPIITGYYGVTESGQVTTLGRGGSDFSATIVAHCLQPVLPTKVIFWKDVDGLLSADPRVEKRAKLLRNISYSEAMELAAFGTKVLHPLSLITLEQRGITAEIRNFSHPDSLNYTEISNVIHKRGEIVKAVTSLPEIALVTVVSEAMVSLPGTAARLFSILGENHVNIMFISQSSSENNITFGVARQDGHKVGELLHSAPHFGTHWFSIKVE
ncbi:MAG TPA: aspartate kinase, partial [Candidatus Lokiarchaeia archaeon]|nr:aspartate kinase [Candidatus Lokiarchaeia archaeon]